MYSPLVVGGSNTHNMPKSKNNKIKSNTSHVFKGCREAFLVPSPRASPGSSQLVQATDSGGNGQFAQILAPMGLSAPVLAGGLFNTPPSQGNLTGPPLRGLFNKCVDFQWYRVTRAKFVFVSNQPSTAIGNITLSAYTEPTDVCTVTFATTVSGPNTRTFSIASAATREISVPVPVDTAWKKCSSDLAIVGNIFPLTATTAAAFCVLNTASDLAFCAVAAYVQGAIPGSTTLGTYYLDYDLELKSPIDSSVNI